MLRRIVLAVCIAATLNMSAGLTGASAAPPRGGHPGGGRPGGGSPGGGHFSGGGGHYRGGPGRGYAGGGYGGGGYVGGGYGYDNGYYPGYDDGYDNNGAAIAAGIIGTALGVIAASQHRCWWQNHRRVCR
jgi:hypothetical protein